MKRRVIKIQNERVLIVGQSGTGKTWAGQFLTQNYVDEHNANVISFSSHKTDLADAHGFDYTNRMKIATLKEKQFYQGFSVKKAITDQPYLHFDIQLQEEEIEELLDEIHQAIFSLSGPTVVVIDEAHTTFSKHHAPRGLVRCITQGRDEGVIPMVILQDITGCNKVAVSQSNHLLAFRVTDTNDIQRLEKRFSAEVTDKLPNLDKYNAVHYNHDSGELEILDLENK